MLSHPKLSLVCMTQMYCRNSRGYEMAKLFGSKLTHLSPVWYELKRYIYMWIEWLAHFASLELQIFSIVILWVSFSEGKKLVLEGRHNVDKEWISELWNNEHPLVIGQSESLIGPKPKLLLGWTELAFFSQIVIYITDSINLLNFLLTNSIMLWST